MGGGVEGPIDNLTLRDRRCVDRQTVISVCLSDVWRGREVF